MRKGGKEAFFCSMAFRFCQGTRHSVPPLLFSVNCAICGLFACPTFCALDGKADTSDKHEGGHMYASYSAV